MALDIVGQRLHNQLLSQMKCDEPDQVVEWFGAVQSQDYAGAKWALSQRLQNMLTDTALDQAFNAGKILRTHVMRPTWHFVTPTDIRWMLELTSPRVLAAMGYMDRQLGLDKTVFKKTNTTLVKALRGGKQLTRSELAPILQKAGVPVDGLRLGHLTGHAELDGVICSGARRGKQFTYALLDERAPQAKKLDHEEALAELAQRYFRSHGPATLKDFVWWSGLTMTDARNGLAAVRSEFESEVVNGQTYWFSKPAPRKKLTTRAYLLPNYDEYTVGYTDRSAIYDGTHDDKLDSRESILAQSILINGEIAGMWKRTVKKNEVIVELTPFLPLTKTENQAMMAEVERYTQFLGAASVRVALK